MVKIRHRTARKQQPSSSLPEYNNNNSIPTAHNRRRKHYLVSSGGIFDFQIPVWLVVVIIVVYYILFHHHYEAPITQLFLDRHKNALSERVSFFQQAAKQRRQYNNPNLQGDDEEEDDENNTMMDNPNDNNDDIVEKTPQENVYWRKQEEDLRKDREEFQKKVLAEEAELEKERQALQKEKEQFQSSSTTTTHLRQQQQQEEEEKKETTTTTTDDAAVISPLEYLQTLSEQHHEDHHDMNHWSVVCSDKLNETPEETAKMKPEILSALIMSCAQEHITSQLVQLNHEVAAETVQRHAIANLLENYTCTDPTVPESPDLMSPYDWHHHHRNPNDPKNSNDEVIRVHVKHDRPASRIHLLENFIDDDECRAMEEAAQPRLHVATTADGKGGSRVSDARKAMQAGITVPWQHEHTQNHPIARLSRRVYDYTNHVLSLNITEDGQEDLMSIQYKGQGYDIPNPDRYTPHCDGDCTGTPHRTGTRMATMVMYCTIPDVGGATNFRNANVHVVPQKGSAVFFSYIDPLTNLTDHHYTEHSGCPVYEGSKKIVTQWIRYGVSKAEPWTAFNTLGIKYVDAKKFE